MNEILPVAPCGINCFICVAHLREKNKCAGCRGTDVNKPITRVKCKLKTCKTLTENKLTFCFECKNFSCDNLKSLDKRYRTKYNMSVIKKNGHAKNAAARSVSIKDTVIAAEKIIEISSGNNS